MQNDPFQWWTSSQVEAGFTDPDAVRARATKFERTIRRRNLIETAAGVVVIALFAMGMATAASEGEWALVLAGAMVVTGTAFVLWHLHRRGSNLVRYPEEDCRTHLLAQLTRQRDLLREVPRWYLAPLVPGICAIYAITATKVAENRGWETALSGVWQPFVATMAFFVFVAWLNWWAARRLAREISALETAT